MSAPGTARFAAAISRHPVASSAIGEAVGTVLDQVGPAPELAVVFVTGAHLRAFGDVVDVVRRVLGPGVLIGATARSILGGNEEVEDEPAVSVWAGRIPGVRALRLDAFDEGSGTTVVGLPEDVLHRPATLVLLAEPMSFPTEAFVRQVADVAPQLTVVGGLASAAGATGQDRLALDGLLLDDGAVGALIDGDVGHAVVSQGCRPLGEPYIVTRSEGNLIFELGGRRALDRVRELIDGATSAERALLGQGLHIGIVIDESQARFSQGDFLVRNVLGGQRDTGAVAIGDIVEAGTTVQFQVRDAMSADVDLRRALRSAPTGVAALVFTCVARGQNLFANPSHDAALVHEKVRGGAVAGMFSAAEIGPVAGRTFLHGHTVTALVFR